MQRLETKSPRPKSFEIENRPEIFETETSKNGSQDASRDRDQVTRLHHWFLTGWKFPTSGKFHPCSGKFFLIWCSEKLFYSNT